MDQNGPEQPPANAPMVTKPQRAAGSHPGPAAPERKPYARPRLTQYGRVTAVTLGSPPPKVSDRNVKEGFESIDSRAVLAAVTALPIARWSYKGESVRHLGPMAQDFAAAFGLGADDRHIFTLDAAGVALAAIQGLHSLVQAQQARLDVLERELTKLRRETAALRVELVLHEAEPVA